MSQSRQKIYRYEGKLYYFTVEISHNAPGKIEESYPLFASPTDKEDKFVSVKTLLEKGEELDLNELN